MKHRGCKSRTTAGERPAGRDGEFPLLVVDSLVVDVAEGKASRYGRPLNLQPRQFDLLVYLARHAGQVVPRSTIADEVWRDGTATWTNIITVNICMLRQELERVGRPTILHTVRGQGYRLGETANPGT